MSEGHSERDVAGEGRVFQTQQKQPRVAIEWFQAGEGDA